MNESGLSPANVCSRCALNRGGPVVYFDRLGDVLCTEPSPLGRALAHSVVETEPRTWRERVVFEIGELSLNLLRKVLDILVRDGKVRPEDIVVAASMRVLNHRSGMPK
jgi:hypothetical protein